MVDRTENIEEDVVDNSSLNSQNDPDTRLEPRRYKESPEMEKIAVVSQHVNVIEEEDELAEDDYELRRREKGKEVEETRNIPPPTLTRSTRIYSTLISSNTEKLQELTITDPRPSSSTPSSSLPKPTLSMSQHILSLFKPKTGLFKQYKNDRVKELTKTQVPIYVALGLIMERQQSQADLVKMIADAIQQEHENLRAEITSQINNAISNHILSQVDSSVRNYMSSYILRVYPTQASQASTQEQNFQLYPIMKDNPQLQHDDLPFWLALKIKFEGLHTDNTHCQTSAIRLRDQDDPYDDAHPEGEPGPSTSGNQEQLDDFDYWTNTYAIDDDELPAEKVSQELVKEMSETVDEAKLCKESTKEILSLPFPQKPIPLVQNCLRDLKAPALSLVNQDFLYLKKGNSGPEKIVLSLHKFLVVIFSDDDTKERTSRWRQKEPGKPIKEVYSNSKIVQVIKTTEIKERLKHRDQMRRWEMYANGRPLGSRRELPE
nr:hypothetical protein [Tanacetum cinerariifolium]